MSRARLPARKRPGTYSPRRRHSRDYFDLDPEYGVRLPRAAEDEGIHGRYLSGTYLARTTRGWDIFAVGRYHNDGCANVRLPPKKLVRITVLTNFTIDY